MESRDKWEKITLKMRKIFYFGERNQVPAKRKVRNKIRNKKIYKNKWNEKTDMGNTTNQYLSRSRRDLTLNI